MKQTIIKYGDDNDFLIQNAEETALNFAIEITNQAKELAPVDTGLLRNSIMWKTSSQKGGFNEGGTKPADKEIDDTPGKGKAFVGSNTEYSIYVEYGTKRTGAQPFLKPAIQIVSGRSPQRVIDALNRLAEKNYKSGKLKKKTRSF